jgi:hypothetical protein
MRQQRFMFDEKRGAVLARIHELKEEGRPHPPRVVLCTLREHN